MPTNAQVTCSGCGHVTMFANCTKAEANGKQYTCPNCLFPLVMAVDVAGKLVGHPLAGRVAA